MRRTQSLAGMMLLAVILCTACAADTNLPLPTTQPTDQTPTPQPLDHDTTPVATAAAPPPELGQTDVDQAVADLSRRLEVPTDAVTVRTVERVVWPDAALGCPEPEQMYAQVLQDGMRIVLQVGSETYHYHSGGARGPFLCSSPLPPSGATTVPQVDQ